MVMKYFRWILALILITQIGFSQTPKQISNSELTSLEQEINKEILKLRQELENKKYFNEYDKQLTIDFKTDTFRIGKLLERRLKIHWSTSEEVLAIIDAEIEYDTLVNKYYQLLLNKLNVTDKGILILTQRNWNQFRESERNFNDEISKDEYSGGGTSQRIIIANRYIEITKKRVLELYGYLARFYN
jgi:uncharacterized protein YecT (DUF1311 family)